jgi:hypothetical protein
MSDVVVVAIVAAVPGLVASVLAYLTRRNLSAVETKVDGRLTQLLELTQKSSHAEGMKDERSDAAAIAFNTKSPS